MKALLIAPPLLNIISTNIPDHREESEGLYPPLGLLYVAAYAQKNTDFDIEVLDAPVERATYDDIAKRICALRPDVVGIYATTFTLIDVIMTARTVKRIDEKIHVCLGGPHVNIYPKETLAFPEIDSLIMGEGEHTFADLLRCVDSRGTLSGVKGIMYKEGSSVFATPPRQPINDLDSLPFPARTSVPYKKYWSVLTNNVPITIMMTSRGCPYNCIFCDRLYLGKGFRARSAENIVDEMAECLNLGIKEILVYDDTFSVDRQRTLDICEQIKARRLKIPWSMRTRVDLVDGELLRALKSAGCVRVHYGVEAGTPEVLKVLRKGITVDQARETLALTKRAGISTLAYFMLGNPAEKRQQILETIALAKKTDPDLAYFSLTTPFPATQLYRLGLEQHIFKNDYWADFARHPSAGFVTEVWEEHANRKELTRLLKYAYRSFYLRPARMYKNLLQINSWRDFKNKLSAAWDLMRAPS